VRSMIPALSAELLELEPVRRLLLVLGCNVVPVLALGALKRDVVSRHNSSTRVFDKLQFVDCLLMPYSRPGRQN